MRESERDNQDRRKHNEQHAINYRKRVNINIFILSSGGYIVNNNYLIKQKDHQIKAQEIELLCK